MAIFRLQISSISRDGGQGSVGAAAYRAGEKLLDERTDQTYNYSRRKDVVHSEILLPANLSGANIEWARNRAALWNTVENAETRKNARVAKEIQVTLPAELSAERRLSLARSFSQEVANNYRVAVDLSLHDPKPAGDPRNFHAHLLLTTREVTASGLGAKAGLEMSMSERARLGLPNMSQEFTAIRERWATLTNEALKSAHIDARVDHRSLAEQGIDREPKPHIPFAAYKMESGGKYSEVAQSIREDYNLRVQQRQARSTELASQRGVESPSQSATAAESAPDGTSARAKAPRSLEDIRREARENWLRMRAERGSPSRDSSAESAQPVKSRTPDDDHQP